MLYIASVGEKTVFIGKCDKTLEAWRTAAERLNAALGKTPAMKPLRLLELICKDDEELEQARKVLVFTLKPIGNWNEWSQFEEDWTHVSYWREAEPKETLEKYIREKYKEQEEKSKLNEVEVLKGIL
jgi:tRNA A37 N6-isopentenylltransferase MiaA